VTEVKDDTEMDLKILRSRLPTPEDTAVQQWEGRVDAQVLLSRDGLFFPCADGSVLVATDVQAPGRQASSASAYVNGMSGRQVFLQR
jgi:hypothetical protein